MRSENRILNAIPPASFLSLSDALTRLRLSSGHLLFEVGAPFDHLYFIESGLVSLARPIHGGRSLEVGTIGREGIVSPLSVFGMNNAITDSTVRISAVVLRIRRDEFQQRLAADANLSTIVQAYGTAALNQFLQTAACNASHSIIERCCRWLLAAHDSEPSETLSLTHETLAAALNVRRESVSTAAEQLQSAGLIAYRHGKLTVTNRTGLLGRACQCYAIIQQGVRAAKC